MKKKYNRIFNFAPFGVLVCFLFVVCSKRPSKLTPAPPWSTIIREYEYLKRTFYDLGYPDDFVLNDSIVEIRLFKSNTMINLDTSANPAPFGIAYVDPDDVSSSYPEGFFYRRFQEIDPNDYFVQRKELWIQFFESLQIYDILGAFYVLRHADASLDTAGFLKDSCHSAEKETCITLKLIKPENPSPTDYTWEYEWRNTYYLGRRNIDEKGFKLDIFKGFPYMEDIHKDLNTQDGTPYLRILGLDQLDLSGNIQPDGLVDQRQIDFSSGYLFFPNRHPFAPYPNISFTENPGDTLKDKVEHLYNSNRIVDHIEGSKYYIHAEIDTSMAFSHLASSFRIERAEAVILENKPWGIDGNGHVKLVELSSYMESP